MEEFLAAIGGIIGFMLEEAVNHFGINVCGGLLDNGYVSSISGCFMTKNTVLVTVVAN